MAGTSKHTLQIDVAAKDYASRTMDKVGNAGVKAQKDIGKAAANTGKIVDAQVKQTTALTEQLSKAASAMGASLGAAAAGMAVANANFEDTQQTVGAMAAAAAGVGSAFAAGGPIGGGIALLATGAGLLVNHLQAAEREAEALKEAIKATGEEFQRLADSGKAIAGGLRERLRLQKEAVYLAELYEGASERQIANLMETNSLIRQQEAHMRQLEDAFEEAIANDTATEAMARELEAAERDYARIVHHAQALNQQLAQAASEFRMDERTAALNAEEEKYLAAQREEIANAERLADIAEERYYAEEARIEGVVKMEERRLELLRATDPLERLRVQHAHQLADASEDERERAAIRARQLVEEEQLAKRILETERARLLALEGTVKAVDEEAEAQKALNALKAEALEYDKETKRQVEEVTQEWKDALAAKEKATGADTGEHRLTRRRRELHEEKQKRESRYRAASAGRGASLGGTGVMSSADAPYGTETFETQEAYLESIAEWQKQLVEEARELEKPLVDVETHSKDAAKEAADAAAQAAKMAAATQQITTSINTLVANLERVNQELQALKDAAAMKAGT